MRFARGDVRDHIVSYKNDHRPSYWPQRTLPQQQSLKIDFREIFGVVRFSTFATISAPLRHADAGSECPLIGDDLKCPAHSQNGAIDPERNGRAACVLDGLSAQSHGSFCVHRQLECGTVGYVCRCLQPATMGFHDSRSNREETSV
jgi:hypothetical protein